MKLVVKAVEEGLRRPGAIVEIKVCKGGEWISTVWGDRVEKRPASVNVYSQNQLIGMFWFADVEITPEAERLMQISKVEALA